MEQTQQINNSKLFKLLIIGDRMLDIYHYGIEDIISLDGGAGNVFSMLSKYLPVNSEMHIISAKNKFVCVKYYHKDDTNNFVMRSHDAKSPLTFMDEIKERFKTYTEVQDFFNSFDIIIFADHDKGVITPQALKEFYSFNPKSLIIVDPKKENTPYYKYGYLIKHNSNEPTSNANNFIYDIQTFGSAGCILKSNTLKSQKFNAKKQDENFINSIGAGDGFLVGIIHFLMKIDLDKPLNVEKMIKVATEEAYQVCCSDTCYNDKRILFI